MVQVVVPSKLSKRQRELLETFAREAGETVGTNGTGIMGRVRDAIG